MALLSVRNLDVRFGGPLLLNQAGFQIHSGEKVCIVGRNGEGKSTLMKIIAGELEPDGGEIIREKGLRVARMPQDIPVDLCGSIHTVVSNALATHMPDYQVDIVLGQMDLDGSQLFENVSGGVKRRVLLACCLVQDPDILLLDEPTNHLDIPSIRWLEGFLVKFEKTILFITHDRTFLQKLATRILELDRGSVLDWDCGYQDFLQRRQDRWDAEEKQNALFDKRLAQEEAWIRKGIKARRTRNEGRVRALERMRQERGDRRERSGNVQMAVASAGNTGKLVLECKNVHFAWENAPLIQDFSSKIMRGDRVGIVGENGCGKTTLLNILLGKLQPNAGEVRHGTNLEVAYFDQHRHELREEETLAENIGNGKDTITINDRSRHVMSYLQDFLFSPERARSPVHVLSGGERNRLLLARLFSKPSNVLVLDEPTNDLDVETLDLLEEQIQEYAGTVIIVSHDRAFLDNVVTSTIVMDGQGFVKEFVGGFTAWLEQSGSEAVKKGWGILLPDSNTKSKSLQPSKEKPSISEPECAEKKKLSYKEQRELELLPAQIEQAESRLEQVQSDLAHPDVYTDHEKVVALNEELQSLESNLEAMYARWSELE